MGPYSAREIRFAERVTELEGQVETLKFWIDTLKNKEHRVQQRLRLLTETLRGLASFELEGNGGLEVFGKVWGPLEEPVGEEPLEEPVAEEQVGEQPLEDPKVEEPFEESQRRSRSRSR